ncbi:hypothetical protein [Streptomyces sp. MH13]|uniref:hypothetical protein n=1 Tax=Streptomyces sp. MH13 TaxID=3417651 RepID=UPI003CF94B08
MRPRQAAVAATRLGLLRVPARADDPGDTGQDVRGAGRAAHGIVRGTLAPAEDAAADRAVARGTSTGRPR